MTKLSESDVEMFLKDMVSALVSLLPEAAHQWNPMTYTITKTRSTRTKLSTRPDFLGAIIRGRDSIPALEKFENTISADSQYKKFKKMYAEQNEGAEFPQGQLTDITRALALDYLLTTDRLAFDPKLASTIANNFMNSWRLGETRLLCFAVLRGVHGDLSNVEIGNGYRIRRIDQPELAFLVDKFPQLLSDGMPANQYVLEKPWVLRIGKDGYPDNGIGQGFTAIISALRLIKSSAVEIDHIYWRSEYVGAPIPAFYGILGSQDKRHPPTWSYEFGEEEARELQVLVQITSKKSLPQRIRTAIERLDMAAVRMRPEDKIIDALISLEALFGDGQGAIGYKIGLRCAVFLEDRFELREELFRVIQDAYKRRSAFVHGGSKRSSDGRNDNTISTDLIDYARRSLKKMLEAIAETGQQIEAKEIDAMLLGKNVGSG